MSLTMQITLLLVLLSLGVILIVFRNNVYVKKYWKFGLVLIPGILLLVLKIIMTIQQKNQSGTIQQDPVKDQILDIKEKIQEINMTTKVEAAIAKEQNDEKMKELQEVQNIPDDRERRKRLAQMIG